MNQSLNQGTSQIFIIKYESVNCWTYEPDEQWATVDQWTRELDKQEPVHTIFPIP